MFGPDTAVSLCQNLFTQTLAFLTPVLAAGIAVGLIIGALQTATQVQEQTLSIAAKIIVMGYAALKILPWAITRLADYTHALIEAIGGQIGGPL